MNRIDELPIKPTRVVVDNGGFGVTPEIAKSRYGFMPDIMFLRSDGWSLGAPLKFEEIAYRMWSDQWTHYTFAWNDRWFPIESYVK